MLFKVFKPCLNAWSRRYSFANTERTQSYLVSTSYIALVSRLVVSCGILFYLTVDLCVSCFQAFDSCHVFHCSYACVMSFPGNTLWHFCCSLNLGTIGSGWMWSCVLLRTGVGLAGKFPGSAGNLGLLLSALMSKGTCWDPCWKQCTLKCSSTMKCSWEKLQTSRITGAVLNLLKIHLMPAGCNCCVAAAFLQWEE